MKSISAGTVTVGVIAIMFGLLAAYVVRRSLEHEPAKAVVKDDRVPMVVAKSNIPRHTIISADLLEVVKVPADRFPENGVRNPNLLVARVARESIEAGARISEEQVYGVGERPTLTGSLEPGFRALPIGVSLNNITATALSSGAFVDVHLTFEDSNPEIGGLATKTLLKNVRILAKDLGNGRPTRAGVGSATLTVAVTADQANKLITAQKAGTLSVTLCGDQERGATIDAENEMLTKTELFGLTVPRSYTVQKWSGDRMETVVLAQDVVRESRSGTAADEARRHPRSMPTSVEDPLAGERPHPDDHIAIGTRN